MANEDLGQDATLFDEGIPLWVDAEVEVDDDGIFNLVVYLTVDEFEEITIRKPFHEITEQVLNDDETTYSSLYAISNDMVRESEVIREKAQRMEDSTGNVSDLFDADDAT